MKRFWLLFVAVLVLLPLAGCYEEKVEPVPDDVMHHGDHKMFTLGQEVADLKVSEVECVLKDTLGNIFKRDAIVDFISGNADFNLKYGLREGYYNLLCINFKSSNPNDMDGIESIGIGRFLDIKEGQIHVVGAYSPEYKFGGSGTAEDPYQISTAQDLYNLQGYVNGDGGERKFVGAHFVQTQDIDLMEYSYYVNMEYGWQPIGKSYSNPFQAYYNGNGYSVSGIFINRGEQSATGLFGMLFNAAIENLTISNSIIKGDGAVGAVAGGSRGNGDDVPYVSIIKNCHVTGCEISGNVAVGGIMGMVDTKNRLLIENCSTSSSTKVSSAGYGVGGILGAGVYSSTVMISSCNNYANIYGGLVNTGGIAGGADTIMITSSFNYGEVGSSAAESRAVGGILGGSGTAVLLDVHNTGSVKGYKGIGGILGSTLIYEESDGSNATYNTAYIYSSHNEGSVNGNHRVAGICGEAQLVANQCYNDAEVKAEGAYVGGILGTTPVSAVHDVANFGKILGDSNVGGIIGKVNEGSYASNVNLGEVTGKRGSVGGIIGKSGNQSMVHHCGNFGKMRLEGNGNLGGIVGEVGDPREWSGMDIANVVIASVEMALSVAGFAIPAVATLAKASDKAMEGINIAMAVKDVIVLTYDTKVYNFGAISSFVNLINPSDVEVETMKNEMEIAVQENYNRMDSIIFARVKSSIVNSTLDTASIFRAERNRVNSMEFYRKSADNQKLYNDNINISLRSRYEEIEHNKKIDNMIHSIVGGVAIVASIAALAVGTAVSGGAALLVAAGGMVAGLVGGANSVSKAVRNFESNVLEISQCYNFGALDAPEDANAAGIAGKIAEYTYISDCLNGGEYADGSFPIAEEIARESRIDNSLDLCGTEVRAIADYDSHIYEYNNNMILCQGKSEEDLDDLYYELGFNSSKTGLDPLSERCILVPSTACKSSSYVDWSIGENNMWIINKEGVLGSFAVPNVSKMTKK